MKDTENTQNENKVETITLIVPEEYEDFNKKIVFILPNDDIVWDIIEDNTYEITKAITQYEKVRFYIWLTKGDMDFRTKTRAINFFDNKDASGEITPEEISGVNTVINLLEEEITKVEGLENDISDLIDDIQNRLDNGEFNAKINGKNAIEIEAGNNISIDETTNGIRINSTGDGSSLPTYPTFDKNKQYVLILLPNQAQTKYELKWKEVIIAGSNQLITSDNFVFKTADGDNFILKEEN